MWYKGVKDLTEAPKELIVPRSSSNLSIEPTISSWVCTTDPQQLVRYVAHSLRTTCMFSTRVMLVTANRREEQHNQNAQQ